MAKLLIDIATELKQGHSVFSISSHYSENYLKKGNPVVWNKKKMG